MEVVAEELFHQKLSLFEDVLLLFLYESARSSI
uniref:Uncharacterized protein n=1 Tax=Rhizophora mucronata TaxID=61149 RepID=A0A2P2N762_RHIMU